MRCVYHQEKFSASVFSPQWSVVCPLVPSYKGILSATSPLFATKTTKVYSIQKQYKKHHVLFTQYIHKTWTTVTINWDYMGRPTAYHHTSVLL